MPKQDGIGTKATGYATPEQGPFRCDHCQFFDKPSCCDHPKVIADPQLRKIECEGKLHAKVQHDACCNLFVPVKKITETTFEEAGI